MQCVVALEGDLVIEFDRLRKLGVKISTSKLEAIAKSVTRESIRESYFYEMRAGPDNRLPVHLF